MPRNSQGVYSQPAGTTAVSQKTIGSAAFNTLIADIAADLNLDRPISAGGTAGSTPAEARTGLELDKKVVYATKSGAYTALAADNNAVMRFSASATLSLTAAATLGANWHVTIVADGGDVTVDPNASEQISGAATLLVPQGYSATIICDGTNFRTVFLAPAAVSTPSSVARGYLSGLTLSNNASDAANDIDIAVGSCIDSTNTYVMTLSSGITKRLDALWTVGTNQGGLDYGAPANISYHVYVIKRLDTGVVDVLFSLPNPVPTLPANYTVYRRIGSIFRDAGAILGFSQFGDEFLFNTPVLNVDVTGGPGHAARVLTVPVGVKVLAKIRVRGNNAATWGVLVYPVDVPAMTPSNTNTPGYTVGGSAGEPDRQTLEVRTNTAGQIRTSFTDASTELQIVTYGWVDTRGR